MSHNKDIAFERLFQNLQCADRACVLLREAGLLASIPAD